MTIQLLTNYTTRYTTAGALELVESPRFELFTSAAEAVVELRRETQRGRIRWDIPPLEALRDVGMAEEFGADDSATLHKWAAVPWYGPLDVYLTPTPGAAFVSDVLINGPDSPVTIFEYGKRIETDMRLHPEWIAFLQRQLAVHSGMAPAEAPERWKSKKKGVKYATLMIGSIAGRIRYSMTRPPYTPEGRSLQIRILPPVWPKLDDLMLDGMFTPEMRDVLLHAARKGVTLLVAGGTGSGKTTLTSALLQAIGGEQRAVVIEEARELPRLRDSLHMEVLQSEWSFSEAVYQTLRMKPDRVVVGEVRGPEALAMLQAAATGHPGMGTIHAPDAQTALANLERMACEDKSLPPDIVRRMIGAKSAPLLVIHVGRYGGKRRIGLITFVLPNAAAQAGQGYPLHNVFEWDDQTNRYQFRPLNQPWTEGRF